MNEAVGDDALDEIMAKDANGDGVPDWCNPVTEMGAWLNFRKMRLWCAENGWTDFGPYGGVPSEEEDEGVGEGDAVIGARDDLMSFLWINLSNQKYLLTDWGCFNGNIICKMICENEIIRKNQLLKRPSGWAPKARATITTTRWTRRETIT